MADLKSILTDPTRRQQVVRDAERLLDEEVDRKSTRLLAALEPALIVFMFAIIGSLLMAILLPILSASRGIGR